jgi:hypothetical protein
MKYIKNFRIFENEEKSWKKIYDDEEDVFLVNEETTPDELESVLDIYVDGLHDYGSGHSIVIKCCDILRDSILFVRNEEGELGDSGKEEDYAYKIYDEFEGRFDDNYSIKRNEYDEGTISGVLKLDGRPVFEYESHDDGYGFSGELINVNHILEVMLDLLQR